MTVRTAGMVEIGFLITPTARLAGGTEAQLKNTEVSPFGLHWPDMDEDLSFKGLWTGEFWKDAFVVSRQAERGCLASERTAFCRKLASQDPEQ